MEEGQTVEIQETREPLREQGSIRVLLELLEQQGMNQEKGDVLRMADYIDSMEMQLGTVLKELGEVKKQLGVMQESKVKLFAVNTIQKAEHQVKTLRFQVGEWKRKFVERAEQAVFDFKEKGKDALACAVKGTVSYTHLSLIVLNELDWWVSSQWETFTPNGVKKGNMKGSLSLIHI